MSDSPLDISDGEVWASPDPNVATPSGEVSAGKTDGNDQVQEGSASESRPENVDEVALAVLVNSHGWYNSASPVPNLYFFQRLWKQCPIPSPFAHMEASVDRDIWDWTSKAVRRTWLGFEFDRRTALEAILKERSGIVCSVPSEASSVPSEEAVGNTIGESDRWLQSLSAGRNDWEFLLNDFLSPSDRIDSWKGKSLHIRRLQRRLIGKSKTPAKPKEKFFIVNHNCDNIVLNNGHHSLPGAVVGPLSDFATIEIDDSIVLFWWKDTSALTYVPKDFDAGRKFSGSTPRADDSGSPPKPNSSPRTPPRDTNPASPQGNSSDPGPDPDSGRSSSKRKRTDNVIDDDASKDEAGQSTPVLSRHQTSSRDSSPSKKLKTNVPEPPVVNVGAQKNVAGEDPTEGSEQGTDPPVSSPSEKSKASVQGTPIAKPAASESVPRPPPAEVKQNTWRDLFVERMKRHWEDAEPERTHLRNVKTAKRAISKAANEVQKAAQEVEEGEESERARLSEKVRQAEQVSKAMQAKHAEQARQPVFHDAESLQAILDDIVVSAIATFWQGLRIEGNCLHAYGCHDDLLAAAPENGDSGSGTQGPGVVGAPCDFIIPIILAPKTGPLDYDGVGHYILAIGSYEKESNVVTLEFWNSLQSDSVWGTEENIDEIIRIVKKRILKGRWPYDQTQGAGQEPHISMSGMRRRKSPRQPRDCSCGFYLILNAWCVMLGIPVITQRTKVKSPKNFHKHGLEILNLALMGHMDSITVQAFVNLYSYSDAQSTDAIVDEVNAVGMNEAILREIMKNAAGEEDDAEFKKAIEESRRGYIQSEPPAPTPDDDKPLSDLDSLFDDNGPTPSKDILYNGSEPSNLSNDAEDQVEVESSESSSKEDSSSKKDSSEKDSSTKK